MGSKFYQCKEHKESHILHTGPLRSSAVTSNQEFLYSDLKLTLNLITGQNQDAGAGSNTHTRRSGRETLGGGAGGWGCEWNPSVTESERRSPQPVLMGDRMTSQSGLARIRKPKQRERERLEKQHMQGDHLFPHLCSLSFILSGWGGGVGGSAHTLRRPLSFTLTWSVAVLRSFASHFLQTAVVHFLQ